MNRLAKTAVIVATALLGAGGLTVVAANASTTTYCPNAVPDSGDSTRDFYVTIDDGAAGCVLSGTGNTDTSANAAAIDAANGDAELLDKTDETDISDVVLTVTGAVSGMWEIIVPDGYVLTDVYIAFKTGVGGGDPDWALFSIPDDVLSGAWGIDNPQCTSGCQGYQSLSHASIYGTLVPAPVPLPAAGLLLLGGLGALGLAKRRRKAA